MPKSRTRLACLRPSGALSDPKVNENVPFSPWPALRPAPLSFRIVNHGEGQWILVRLPCSHHPSVEPRVGPQMTASRRGLAVCSAQTRRASFDRSTTKAAPQRPRFSRWSEVSPPPGPPRGLVMTARSGGDRQERPAKGAPWRQMEAAALKVAACGGGGRFGARARAKQRNFRIPL